MYDYRFCYRPQSSRRLCFNTCLSVILFTGGKYLGRYTPWAGTPLPPSRYTPPPAGTPLPPSRYTPVGRYIPPWEGTPPSRYTPLGRYTPREQCMLGDTGNKRAVRILLECILVLFFFGNDNPCQLTTYVTVFPVDFQRLFYFLCSALIIKQGLVV